MAIDISFLKFDINAEPSVILQFKQHDNLSRVILLELTDEGSPLDLNGCSAVLYAKKPDETQVFQACEVIDADYGQLRVALKQQVLSCAGEVLCEVVINGSDRVLTTRTFKINVIPCIRDESSVASTDDFTDLQQLLSGCTAANEIAEIFNDGFEAYVEDGGTMTFAQWLANFKGERGQTGAAGTSRYVHFRYADSASPASSGQIYSTPLNHSYLGVYSGTSSTAPTSPSSYTWMCFKGEKGDTGAAGSPGAAGAPGTTPHIGSNYHWFTGSQDTGIDARGVPGEPGEPGEPGIVLHQYTDYTAYQTALSQGLVAENELSYWGQS